MTSARVALLAGLLLTLALIGLEARYQRHAGPLWRDEVTSVNVAAQPTLAGVLTAVPYDSFPLGWPLVLHGWIAAGQGDSDGELRRLGFVVMLATFAVLWWAGRRLGLDAPLVTLLLLGMSPSVLVYGGQVRGYGLGALTIAWCFAATWHYLHAPGAGRLLLAALAATAAVQTYFANAFLVAAFAVGGAAVTLPARRTHALAGLVAVDALAAASLLLDLPSFTYALQVAPLEQRETSLAWLVEVFRHALAPGVPLLAACWILAPVLAIAGCLWTWRRAAQDRAAADLACFVLVSALAALPAYFGYLHGVARLPTQYWYYLSLMAVLALACDAGTALLARRWRHGALARTAVVAATALA
ncbi:MAG TPA: hypothetical protein VNO26_09385, partial [Candidatus Limnocylindria bacterium]|nr:hypothetical protein [Candidatus Limnocylindria bacterium]